MGSTVTEAVYYAYCAVFARVICIAVYYAICMPMLIVSLMSVQMQK